MKRPQILIVEDESVIAMDIEEALLSLNYDVSGKAANAEEAFTSITNKRPELVLMDIHLEGDVDGIEAASKIKEQFDVPVIFLTAFADKATLDRAKIVEPYGYVLKPFRQTELRTVIELALHRHTSDRYRREASTGNPTSSAVVNKIPNFQSLIPNAHKPSQAMQVTVKSFLESISPLSELNQEALQAIASVCIVQTYGPNTNIVHEGGERKDGFIVMSGRVGVFKTSAGGKELVVELLGPQDLFGFLAVLDRAPFPFSARTQNETRILWVPREAIYHITDSYPEISRELFRRVLDRLRKAHDLSRSLAHDKVEIRVASALVAMIDRFTSGDSTNDKGIAELEMTRQEMGELVGTAPETVSRILNRFESEGIVDLSVTGKVLINDPSKLTAMIKGDSSAA